MSTLPIPPEDAKSIDDNILPETAPSSPPLLHTESGTSGNAVAKATVGIGFLHFLRLVVGFVAQPLIASSLGLKWHADAYAVSTDIIQRIWMLFEKLINPAFLPNFVASLKADGEERAWRFASTTIWLVSLILLITTPLAWWGMPGLVGMLSQKADQEQINLTVVMARWLLVGLFCLGFSSLTYTILNGYKRFAMAALGDTLWKVGLLAGAMVAVVTKAPPERALWLVTLGFMVGSFLKLAPHLWAIGKKWRFLKPKIDWRDPLVSKMLLLGVPLLLGIVISEMRGLYLLRLADDPSIQIEASRAALRWSRIIGDNLLQIFPYALSIGIFPYLADMATNKNKQPLTDTMVGALRVCVFVFLPITTILIALRFPLLRAVWESGNLTQADTILMSAPFVAFAVGLVGFACEMQLGQAFYAMTKAWTPTIIGIGTSFLWVVAATIGVENLGWGLMAIAGAESLAKTIKCLIMWVLLRPYLGEIKWGGHLAFTLKVILGAIVAALVAAYISQFLSSGETASPSKMKMLLSVFISGCAGMLAFFGMCALMRVQEMASVKTGGQKLARKFRK